jgi:hypothetical protein
MSYPCRKYRLADQYCYDFDYVGEHCTVFWNAVYGCCNGVEYKVDEECVGVFEKYDTNRKVCSFDAPKALGPCREGFSLPSGMQTPPSSNPPTGPSSTGLTTGSRTTPLLRAARRKLGSCARCMRASFSLTALTWFIVGAASQAAPPLFGLLASAALAPTILSFAHVIAFAIRGIAERERRSCDCDSPTGLGRRSSRLMIELP